MPVRIAADIRWNLRMIRNWWNKRFNLSRLTLESSTPDRFRETTVSRGLRIPMRDGIRLVADLYLPKGSGPFPTILIRMPYGRDEYYCGLPAHGHYWARKGYACLIQDVRGKYDSEGMWVPFVNEGDDGYDTIDWTTKQTWCNGSIGMTGESYYGYTCWAAATLKHPALKCIAPGITATDISHVWVYNSNVYCVRTMGVWPIEMNAQRRNNFLRLNHWHLPLIEKDQEAGFPTSYYPDWIRNGPDSPYWDEINLDPASVEIPVLNWGGWYDTFLLGTILDWQRGPKAASPTHGPIQRLLIGPIDHELTTSYSKQIGRTKLSDDCWSYDLIQHFFDYWLRGENEGYRDEPPIRVYLIGKNEWIGLAQWPPAESTPTRWFLSASSTARDGTLSLTLPVESTAEYTYDPANPVAETLRTNQWRIIADMQNRELLPSRADILCFTSSQLDHDIDVVGTVSVELFASSSARDTDFTAALVEVFPDGFSQLVQEGIVRGRFREPEKGDQPLEPGTIYRFSIDLWAVAYRFRKSHRIRVEVSSSNFSRYDRNLNTLEPFGMSDKFEPAHQRILCGGRYPSAIVLPVFRGSAPNIS